VQESFLQAFVALDRLRDPDRFAAWLAGIVPNVCRGVARRAPVTLLPDWPEPLHPASADGLPSAEDLDRADALRAAVADYACVAEGGIAVLSAAVPQPAGFSFLGQEIFADDYRGAVVTFRGEFRTEDTAGSAVLFLRIHTDPRNLRGPHTEQATTDDPGNNLVTITGHRDWTSHEVTARVSDDANIVMFGVFLSGRGRIELRDAELTRGG
jgi:hypothetical protein